MRRTLTAVVVLAALVARTALLLGPWASPPADRATDTTFVSADPGDPSDLDGEGPGEANAEKAPRGGPPAWARSVSKGKLKGSLKAWKSLSPDAREQLMTRLAGEHEAGMKAYQACRAEGRPDCSKPLPPGLAKRQ